MLLHYKLSRWLPFLSFFLNTSFGFCNYCYHNKNIHSLERFPELLAQKPVFMYSSLTGLWFKYGAKEPRIKCIRKAIKLIEDKLKGAL